MTWFQSVCEAPLPSACQMERSSWLIRAKEGAKSMANWETVLDFKLQTWEALFVTLRNLRSALFRYTIHNDTLFYHHAIMVALRSFIFCKALEKSLCSLFAAYKARLLNLQVSRHWTQNMSRLHIHIHIATAPLLSKSHSLESQSFPKLSSNPCMECGNSFLGFSSHDVTTAWRQSFSPLV